MAKSFLSLSLCCPRNCKLVMRSFHDFWLTASVSRMIRRTFCRRVGSDEPRAANKDFSVAESSISRHVLSAILRLPSSANQESGALGRWRGWRAGAGWYALILCSCSAQEWDSPAMSVVAVIPAGAVPSTIAVMMRGDTKASRAR